MKNTLKAYIYLTAIATMSTIISLYCLIIGLFASIWFPFIVWELLEVILGLWLARDMYNNFRYKCPVCGEVFQPEFKEFMFSKHKLGERMVTCPKCHITGMCDEIHMKDI